MAQPEREAFLTAKHRITCTTPGLIGQRMARSDRATGHVDTSHPQDAPPLRSLCLAAAALALSWPADARAEPPKFLPYGREVSVETRFDGEGMHVELIQEVECNFSRAWMWGVFRATGPCLVPTAVAPSRNLTVGPLEPLRLGIVPLPFNKVKPRSYMARSEVSLTLLAGDARIELPVDYASGSYGVAHASLFGPMVRLALADPAAAVRAVEWLAAIEEAWTSKDDGPGSQLGLETKPYSFSTSWSGYLESACDYAHQLEDPDWREISGGIAFDASAPLALSNTCAEFPVVDLLCSSLDSQLSTEDSAAYAARLTYCRNADNKPRERLERAASLVAERLASDAYLEGVDTYVFLSNLEAFMEATHAAGNPGSAKRVIEAAVVGYTESASLRRSGHLGRGTGVEPVFASLLELAGHHGASTGPARTAYLQVLTAHIEQTLEAVPANLSGVALLEHLGQLVEGHKALLGRARSQELRRKLEDSLVETVVGLAANPPSSLSDTALADVEGRLGFASTARLRQALRSEIQGMVTDEHLPDRQLYAFVHLLGDDWVRGVVEVWANERVTSALAAVDLTAAQEVFCAYRDSLSPDNRSLAYSWLSSARGATLSGQISAALDKFQSAEDARARRLASSCIVPSSADSTRRRFRRDLAVFLWLKRYEIKLGVFPGEETMEDVEEMVDHSIKQHGYPADMGNMLADYRYRRHLGVDPAVFERCLLDPQFCPAEDISSLSRSAERASQAEVEATIAELRLQARIIAEATSRLGSDPAAEWFWSRGRILAEAVSKLEGEPDPMVRGVMTRQLEVFRCPGLTEAAAGMEVEGLDSRSLKELLSHCSQIDKTALARLEQNNANALGEGQWRVDETADPGCETVQLPPAGREVTVTRYSSTSVSRALGAWTGPVACLSDAAPPLFGIDQAVLLCKAVDGRIESRTCPTASGRVVLATERSANRCQISCGAVVAGTCSPVQGEHPRCE